MAVNNDGHGVEKHSGSMPSLHRSKSTPGPGQYVWKDDVHLKCNPKASVLAPDRRALDLMVPTWTPKTSLLPSPDPGAYGELSTIGPRGRFSSPKWNMQSGIIRPCLAPPPPEKVEIVTKIPTAFGAVKNPTIKMPPCWSVQGKDRSLLPVDLPTWTPKPAAEMRPGPGQYDLTRAPKWKAVNRRGCTFGTRIQNLHLEERAWIPQTTGSRLANGEWMRMAKGNLKV